MNTPDHRPQQLKAYTPRVRGYSLAALCLLLAPMGRFVHGGDASFCPTGAASARQATEAAGLIGY